MTTPQAIRHQLHQLITSAIVGHGIAVEDVYPYRTARFRDAAPTHAVITTHRLSASPLTQGEQLPHFLFRVMVFARYNDQASEAAAEEALDSLEMLSLTALASAEADDLWESLDFLDGPERTSVEVLGKFYRLAQQIIKVEIN